MTAAIRLPLGSRYALVGGSCLVCNNLLLVTADRLALPLLAGVGVAFSVVGTLGYLLHCRFTFETAPSWCGLARFFCAMAANTPLSIAMLWMFTHLMAWPMAAAAPVASAAMIFVNFIASRLAILGVGGGRRGTGARDGGGALKGRAG